MSARKILTLVGLATSVIASLAWVLFAYGFGLRRESELLLQQENSHYWCLAVGSPVSLVLLLFYPFLVDLIKNKPFRIITTLVFVAGMVWHFAYSGAVLNTSSTEIFTGNRLITNYLGLIFTGSLGTLVFSGLSTGLFYLRDLLDLEELGKL